MISWEALSAISSAAGTAVIAATALVGYRQVRLAGDQLAHLRSATQLDGTMKVFTELESPRFRSARLFVANELEGRMQDPSYRDRLSSLVATVDENEHKEIIVSRTFEKIGMYARHGLLDPVLIAVYCGPVIREISKCASSSDIVLLERGSRPR